MQRSAADTKKARRNDGPVVAPSFFSSASVGVRIGFELPIDAPQWGCFGGMSSGPHCITFHGLFRIDSGSVPGRKYST